MALNPSQLMIDAINQGKLTHADANAIARQAGFTDAFGEGRAVKFFDSNPQASQNALKTLSDRGLVPTQSLQSYMQSTVNNPSLPSGTTLTPQTMSVQQGELQTPRQVSTSTIPAAPQVTTPTIEASQATLDDLMVNYQQALDKISTGSGQYSAALVGQQTPQAQAAQGQVSELATVQGQLKKLYADSEGQDVPLWAKGAVRKAEDVLAARRLGASSIAAGAITEAIQQSALNIAAQDASAYFQMDISNLANEQQTRLENVRMKQQSLLTDTAALNAAAQFNASSQAQVEQFQASLISNIQTNNANRVASMKQFNTAEVNKINMANVANQIQVDSFNSQQALAVNTFNAQAKFQAETFNAQMASTVDASNVVWRRSINTANTAAINAANQLNVQNSFNLSNAALSALWQQTRDEANWLWTSAENEAKYYRELGLVGSERDAKKYLQDSNNDFEATNKLYEAIGGVARSILEKYIS